MIRIAELKKILIYNIQSIPYDSLYMISTCYEHKHLFMTF